MQGYASIEDGEFDTSKSGQAVAIGPTIIRITGGDGVGVDGIKIFGNLLFEEYYAQEDITSDNDPLVIDIPATTDFVMPDRD